MLSLTSLALTIFAILRLTTCACGHLDRSNLLVTGGLAGMAWLPFLIPVRHGLVARIIIIASLILPTLVLGRNLLDILWFGHDPIF